MGTCLSVLLLILAVAFIVKAWVTRNSDLVDKDDDDRFWTDRN